jgi:hypothetical protein
LCPLYRLICIDLLSLLGRSEVANLYIPHAGKQKVVWLDIAMEDVFLLSFAEKSDEGLEKG